MEMDDDNLNSILEILTQQSLSLHKFEFFIFLLPLVSS